MSVCIVNNRKITPCTGLNSIIDVVNQDIENVKPGQIGMMSYVNHSHLPNSDIIYAITRVANMPTILDYCPFCGESIKTLEG